MIESERLLLIPVDTKMIDSLIESDESFLHTYGYINDGGAYLKPSPDYLIKIKQRLLQHPEEYPLAVDHLIVVKNIKTVIGTIYYKNLPDSEGVSEVGYGMKAIYEDNGYMSEALNAMLDYGKKSGIKIVVADTTFQNTNSPNVLKRCGFSVLSVQEDRLWFRIIL